MLAVNSVSFFSFFLPRLEWSKTEWQCRDSVICTTAFTPKLRFWSWLPWWPHLVNIPWEWFTLLQVLFQQNTHEPQQVLAQTWQRPRWLQSVAKPQTKDWCCCCVIKPRKTRPSRMDILTRPTRMVILTRPTRMVILTTGIFHSNTFQGAVKLFCRLSSVLLVTADLFWGKKWPNTSHGIRMVKGTICTRCCNQNYVNWVLDDFTLATVGIHWNTIALQPSQGGDTRELEFWKIYSAVFNTTLCVIVTNGFNG